VLRSLNSTKGYTIRGIDDQVGSVNDYYFDDREWHVRYIVADTGNWLPGRLVLIAPSTAAEPDWHSRTLPVKLSKEQIENGPGVSKDQPVSKQKQIELHEYYRWPIFWQPEVGPPPFVYSEGSRPTAEDRAADPHLRSVNEVSGYHIQARDDEVGHVEDFIVEDETWRIRYIVVDTRNWLPGKEVVLSPQWISSVDWAASKVHVDLTRESIKDSPAFDPSQPVNRAYEERLYDYYGRPKYWLGS
jgi:hypothetical protein